MGSKSKKKKDKKKNKKHDIKTESKNDISSKLDKLDSLVELDNLRNLAINHKANGNYEEAINISDKVIRLAIKCNIPSIIEEQEKFMNSMAEKVQEDYFISKIKEVSEVIRDQYINLINENRIMQAHALIESFKKDFSEISYFESIPAVQELIAVDKRNWVKYQSNVNEDYQEIFNDEKGEINVIINALSKYYEELINAKQYDEAHKLINDFVKKYEDNSTIMALPSVQGLLRKKMNLT
ncbi:MAG: hypothetical protein ACFFAO_18885 [Candidatus Hermodarchaeota archaeon]